MPKHTAPPWRHIKSTPEIVGPQGCSIAVTAPYYKSGDVESDEQQEANGYIMAAAPDMYEALKAILRAPLPQGSYAPGSSTIEVLTIPTIHLQAARAAIEKAEGRSQ